MGAGVEAGSDPYPLKAISCNAVVKRPSPCHAHKAACNDPGSLEADASRAEVLAKGACRDPYHGPCP